MNSAALRIRIIASIDGYLQRTQSGKEVAARAAEALASHSFVSSEVLLDEALCAMADLGHEDPHWDTAREELQNLRDALLGKADYVMALRWQSGSTQET
jgi:hypothetical protein